MESNVCRFRQRCEDLFLNAARFKKRVLWCGVVIAIILAIPAGIALWAGFHDQIAHADVGIVLANKVLPDGRPSLSLQSRLDKALELYRQGWFERIIVSGGIGKRQEDEAAVMREYLIAHGVPAERIDADNRGINTWWTGRNASQLMAERGWKSALVITQYYHIYRSKMVLERFGVHPVYTAHANLFQWRDTYSTVREAMALIVYQFYHYGTAAK